MSYISSSSPQQKLSAWRISEQTKIANKEISDINRSYILPERFSPSRNGVNDSRLFNSSLQRMKLSQIGQKNDKSVTPKKDRVLLQSSESLSILKQSIQVLKDTPRKMQERPSLHLKNQESFVSMGDNELKMLKQEIKRSLKEEYETNRKLILDLIKEFNRFKTIVLEEIGHQKNYVSDFMAKIQQCFSRESIKLSQSSKAVKQNNLNTESHIKPHNQFNLVQKEQIKCDKLQRQMKENDQFIQTLKKDNPQFISIFPNDNQDTKIKIQAPTTQICIIAEDKRTIVETPENIKHQEISNLRQVQNSENNKRQSPNLQKCTHIVETIGILNQINDSPIITSKNESKSEEKQIIEGYKKRIMAITKSNDNLFREKSRQKTIINEQQLKVKGNFKLQKFYNAISKLKQQVNEIKNINDKKDNQKNRILKDLQ